MPPKKTQLSVILPIYNELENLPRLISEVEVVLGGTGETFEVITVDDGSRDGSAEWLVECAKKNSFLKVILFRGNCGQTAAIDAGFRYANGEILITMDSDLQNDARDIPKMLKILNEGYDCVAGWRKQRKDGYWLRIIPSKIANWLIRKLMRTELHDLGCSLKVFRREITKELKLYGEMHRLMGVLVEGLGARVAEFEVNHRPRVQGQSKYNLTRSYKVLLDLVTAWFLQGYRTKPIYVFGGLGASLISVSSFLTGYVLWGKLFWMEKVHRNPLFMIAIFLCVIGIQFVVLGLLAELVIRTYYESRNQKPYSIARMINFSSSRRLAMAS